jgi:hypothetical protein
LKYFIFAFFLMNNAYYASFMVQCVLPLQFFPIKSYTKAGFEPGSFVSQGVAMATEPRRQGMA